MQALGLIEVDGYLAAVEAADAALKAANVNLLGIEIVKAGIATVEITGDVGAVKASVDTGAAAAQNLGLLRSISVIPRLHEETLKIIPQMKKEVDNDENTEYKNNTNEHNLSEEKNIVEKILIEENKQYEKVEEIIEEDIVREDEVKDSEQDINDKSEKKAEDYAGIKVEELRRMVRKLNLPGMTNKEIKFAKKDFLIKILLDNNKEGDK